jgi:hypothetical protein
MVLYFLTILALLGEKCMSMDASIRNWKGTVPVETGYPDFWPGWTTPDVFVDNNGNRIATTTTAPHVTGPFKYYLNVNEPGEPTLGIADNRLFLVIRNLGGKPAPGVQVTVQYAPMSTVGGLWVTAHFKLIDQFSIDLDATGTMDGEKELEVQWDLSDVTDTNGGLWPYPLGVFNHFCVQVQLTLAGDSDLSNNFAQSNFGNVISASPFSVIPLLVANSDHKQRTYEIVAQQLPEKWAVRLRGLKKNNDDKEGPNTGGAKREEKAMTHGGKMEFVLNPGEERFLTLTILPPQEQVHERQLVTIGLATDGKFVGGISVMAGPGAPPRRQGRNLSCGSKILPHNPLHNFFPKEEVVLRYPVQLDQPGTILARISEKPKK